MSPRIHLLLVGGILAVTLLALLATGQINFGKAPDARLAAADASAMLITVSATWGDNCNDYIQSMSNNPGSEDTASHVTATLLPVRHDNALRRVSTLCDAKASCSFPVTTDALGADPAPGCTKALTVDYRCGEMGVTSRLTAYSGSKLSLDCRPPATAQNQ